MTQFGCCCLLFNFQQFITRDAVVDRGSYNVTTYIERKEKEWKGKEKEKEKEKEKGRIEE